LEQNRYAALITLADSLSQSGLIANPNIKIHQ